MPVSSVLMIAIGLPLAAVVLIAALAVWAGRNLKAVSGEDEAGSPLGSDRPASHVHVYDEDGDCTVCGHDMWTPSQGASS